MGRALVPPTTNTHSSSSPWPVKRLFAAKWFGCWNIITIKGWLLTTSSNWICYENPSLIFWCANFKIRLKKIRPCGFKTKAFCTTKKKDTSKSILCKFQQYFQKRTKGISKAQNCVKKGGNLIFICFSTHLMFYYWWVGGAYQSKHFPQLLNVYHGKRICFKLFRNCSFPAVLFNFIFF